MSDRVAIKTRHITLLDNGALSRAPAAGAQHFLLKTKPWPFWVWSLTFTNGLILKAFPVESLGTLAEHPHRRRISRFTMCFVLTVWAGERMRPSVWLGSKSDRTPETTSQGLDRGETAAGRLHPEGR